MSRQPEAPHAARSISSDDDWRHPPSGRGESERGTKEGFRVWVRHSGVLLSMMGPGMGRGAVLCGCIEIRPRRKVKRMERCK